MAIFFGSAHKSDQPVHKVAQSDASPSWLPPAGLLAALEETRTLQVRVVLELHWQGASGKLLLAPPEFSLPRERQVFTP